MKHYKYKNGSTVQKYDVGKFTITNGYWWASDKGLKVCRIGEFDKKVSIVNPLRSHKTLFKIGRIEKLGRAETKEKLKEFLLNLKENQ